MDLTAIRKRFGPDGIRNLAPAYGRLGAITDDTQMTLFTAEGVLRSHVRSAGLGPTSLPGIVGHAYLRWLASQEVEGRAEGIGRDGWLFGHRELFSPRAPGNTCLSALAAREGVGDATPASNRSKGCGGVMRVAPAGLYAASLGLSPEQAFAWGCEVSALTHGHPSGQLPGGALALVIGEMVRGRSLPAAVALAKDSLRRQTAHEETLAAVLAAESLAAASPAEEALPQLGQGWVAEEALAIALCCALRAVNLEEGVIMAANITGDSDSTAAITGNILGAMLGVHEIPDRWLAQLELREVITEMADDLASVADWAIGESNPGTPAQEREQAYWARRYPGW
jgi:ADP-ribosylglycohydrolase